jgi:hypothetical protein
MRDARPLRSKSFGNTYLSLDTISRVGRLGLDLMPAGLSIVHLLSLIARMIERGYLICDRCADSVLIGVLSLRDLKDGTTKALKLTALWSYKG